MAAVAFKKQKRVPKKNPTKAEKKALQRARVVRKLQLRADLRVYEITGNKPTPGLKLKQEKHAKKVFAHLSARKELTVFGAEALEKAKAKRLRKGCRDC